MSVYLNLYHGRNSPSVHLDDWGFEGPILGPFRSIQITYKEHIKLYTDRGLAGDLHFEEDLLYYGGKYYGDFEVITHEDIGKTERIEAVDPVKLQPPDRFCTGDLVRKKKGSDWSGRIVGQYSTALTPVGYCVESDKHPGSVQIYPSHALELVKSNRHE